ncbi:MAG: hypothetical protein L6Q92_15140 [Phycisphaerae bacterium]|nr:hypothetical protein [Phycisphaerae bacterium]
MTHDGRAQMRRSRVAIAVVAGMALAGCTPKGNVLRIESFKQRGAPETLSEHFDEAFFASDAQGHWDIVLRAVRPSPHDVDGELVQVFHARLFWRPVPGTTYAEPSQTDATLCYAILDVDRAISYEGAGFVYFSLDRTGDVMTGTVESGTISPRRADGPAPDLLGPSQVRGHFTAYRNRRWTVEALTTMRQRLGPPPTYRPRGSEPVVR